MAIGNKEALIGEFAGLTLKVFKEVEEKANEKLKDSTSTSPSALANINTLNDTNTTRELSRITSQNFLDCEWLKDEPAIAKVTVEFDGGTKQSFYFCRRTPVHINSAKLATYYSPKGNWASLDLEDEVEDHKLGFGTIVEKATLKPKRVQNLWDAIDTTYSNIEVDSNPQSIQSLREYIEAYSGLQGDLADDVETELLRDDLLAQLSDKVRRVTIERMSLRDQPILDKYQDKIFRLPIDARLLLLGPPGTGKTTTLIKRLAQKRNQEYLTNEEQSLVNNKSSVSPLEHQNSWLMFAPTDLLKQYLKEAFLKEGVPASNAQILTWDTHRNELARKHFPILRTSNNAGLVEKPLTNEIVEQILIDPISVYEAFEMWHKSQFLSEVIKTLEKLIEAGAENSNIEAAISSISKSTEYDFYNLFGLIENLLPAMNLLVDENKKSVDSECQLLWNVKRYSDKAFDEKLAKFLASMENSTDSDVDELEDDDEQEEASQPIGNLRKTRASFFRAISFKGKNKYLGRPSLGKSKSARILEYIGTLDIGDDKLNEIGRRSLLVTYAQRLSQTVRKFIDGKAKAYQDFRRDRLSAHIGADSKTIDRSDASSSEIDIILLSSLTAVRALLMKYPLMDKNSRYWTSLTSKDLIFRNQILVDECTDFSVMQLGCMKSISTPGIDSFFACGDFNQRITNFGVSSLADFNWLAPDILVKEISNPYRQSQKLRIFSEKIINKESGASATDTSSLPIDYNEYSPALLVTSGVTDVAKWVADRISEIERKLRILPSIAVFVNSEEIVEDFAKKLQKELSDVNIPVKPCKDGQTVGEENQIRVFDIRHIKGLEFEAVFFVNLDELSVESPDLYNKFLYVGASRAATFLGLTCAKALPNSLIHLKDEFVVQW